MNEFELKDKEEAYEVIQAALDALGRGDTPFSYMDGTPRCRVGPE